MISALTWIVELNQTGKVLSWMPSSNPDEPPPGLYQLQNAKEAGQVALWIAEWDDIRVKPAGLDEAGLVLIPYLAVLDGWLSRYHSYAHFISKNSTHPQVCWEWFKLLSIPAEVFEGIPARKSVAESPEWEAIVGKTNAEVLRLALSRALPAAPMYLAREKDLIRRPLLDWFGKAVGAALAGTDPAQVLKEAQAKADAYLACLAGVNADDLSYNDLEIKVNACGGQVDP
jgi:hypothetical protein